MIRPHNFDLIIFVFFSSCPCYFPLQEQRVFVCKFDERNVPSFRIPFFLQRNAEE